MIDDTIIYYNQKYTYKDNEYYIYQNDGIKTFLDGNVYGDINYRNYLMKVNESDNNIINESNYNKFSEYKLTFSLENNNLIFKSIDKL